MTLEYTNLNNEEIENIKRLPGNKAAIIHKKRLTVWDQTFDICYRKIEWETYSRPVFSKDGQYIAVDFSGSYSISNELSGIKPINSNDIKSINIYNLKTGLCEIELKRNIAVNSLLISNDSNFLISVAGDRVLKFWDIKSKRCIRTIVDKIDDIMLLDDHKFLVSTFCEKIKVWDISWLWEKRITAPYLFANAIDYHKMEKEENQFSFLLNQTKMYLADKNIRKALNNYHRILDNKHNLSDRQFKEIKKEIAKYGKIKKLRHIELGNIFFSGKENHLSAINTSANLDYLLFLCENNRTIKTWSFKDNKVTDSITLDYLNHKTWLANNKKNILLLLSENIEILNLETGEIFRRIELSESVKRNLQRDRGYIKGCFSKDDRYFILVANNTLMVLNIETAEDTLIINPGRDDNTFIKDATFSFNDKCIICLKWKSIALISFPDGKLIDEINTYKYSKQINFWGISPDEKKIYFGNENGFYAWGLSKNSFLQELLSNGTVSFSYNTSAIISRDGRFLAKVYNKSKIEIWDICGDCLLKKIELPDAIIYDIAFHPNNQSLIVASNLSEPRVWEFYWEYELPDLLPEMNKDPNLDLNQLILQDDSQNKKQTTNENLFIEYLNRIKNLKNEGGKSNLICATHILKSYFEKNSNTDHLKYLISDNSYLDNLNNEALFMLSKNKKEEALKLFEKVIDLEPKYFPAVFNYNLLRYRMRKIDDFELIEEIIKTNTNKFTESYFELAFSLIHIEISKFKEALSYLKNIGKENNSSFDLSQLITLVEGLADNNPECSFFELKISDQPILGVEISKDSTLMLSVDKAGVIRLTSLTTGETINSFNTEMEEVRWLLFSPDNRYAIYGNYSHDYVRHEKDMFIIDITKKDPIPRILKGHQSKINGLVLTNDGRFLLSFCEEGKVKKWHIETGICQISFWAHNSPVTTIKQFGNNLLITGDKKGSIKLWDLISGNCKKEFLGHKREISSIDVDFNNKRFVSADLNAEVRLWSIMTGDCINVFDTNGLKSLPLDGKLVNDGNEVLIQHVQKLDKWSIPDFKHLKSYDFSVNLKRNMIDDVHVIEIGTFARNPFLNYYDLISGNASPRMRINIRPKTGYGLICKYALNRNRMQLLIHINSHDQEGYPYISEEEQETLLWNLFPFLNNNYKAPYIFSSQNDYDSLIKVL